MSTALLTTGTDKYWKKHFAPWLVVWKQGGDHSSSTCYESCAALCNNIHCMIRGKLRVFKDVRETGLSRHWVLCYIFRFSLQQLQQNIRRGQQLRNCIPVGIHMNLLGARDQESTNHSAHFVEWKSSNWFVAFHDLFVACSQAVDVVVAANHVSDAILEERWIGLGRVAKTTGWGTGTRGHEK